jgi:hypothetical protein
MDAVGLHVGNIKLVNTIGKYVTPLCYFKEGVTVFSRHGAVEKLCAALPRPPLLDMFDSNRMDRWDIEYAIRMLCASSPRNRLQVEVLLGKERAEKICK